MASIYCLKPSALNNHWKERVNAIVDLLDKNQPEEAVQIFEKTVVPYAEQLISVKTINEIGERLYAANVKPAQKAEEIRKYAQRAFSPVVQQQSLAPNPVVNPPEPKKPEPKKPEAQPQRKPVENGHPLSFCGASELVGGADPEIQSMIAKYFAPEDCGRQHKKEQPKRVPTPVKPKLKPQPYLGRPAPLNLAELRRQQQISQWTRQAESFTYYNSSSDDDEPALKPKPTLNGVFRPIVEKEVSVESMSYEQQLEFALKLSQRLADDNQPS